MESENAIQTKKTMLEVFAEIDPKTGKRIITWEYGPKINAYFLIGVLEDIKSDLLNQMDNINEEGL